MSANLQVDFVRLKNLESGLLLVVRSLKCFGECLREKNLNTLLEGGVRCYDLTYKQGVTAVASFKIIYFLKKIS